MKTQDVTRRPQRRPRALLAKVLPGLLVAVTPILVNTAFGADITIQGFAKEERWDTITDRATIEDPNFTTPPTLTRFFPSFEAPVGQADNFTERLSATFTPDTTGDYVFFLASDDDADLFLSPDATPANKKMIAQESGWSNNRSWTAVGGGSNSADKRSDTFGGSEWPNATIHLTQGTKYYIELDKHEGGGGDDASATFKLSSEDDPADATPTRLTGSLISSVGPDPGIKITIATQPASGSIQEQLLTSLNVVASGTQTGTTNPPTLFYQWQSAVAGSSTFTNIPGATETSLQTPELLLTQSGLQYRVVVTAPAASLTSSNAVITVVPDTFPPKLLSAGSLQNTNINKTQVTLVFDEPIKDAATAETLGNYSLSGGATISAATYITNAGGVPTRQSGVLLDAAGITPGQSYTVTVKGLADLKGNTMTGSTNLTFTASSQSWASIGDPGAWRPAALAVGTNGFDLVSGGNAFWGTEDDIVMVYDQINGDFDKKAQVEWNDQSSQWARSGISARESLNLGGPTTDDSGTNPASRYQMIISDPAGIDANGVASNDQYETNRRLNTGGATTSLAGAGNPSYPGSWVRLKRVGQWFSMFYSANGVHWIPVRTSGARPGVTDFGSTDISDTPMPATLFVGPTFSSENGNLTDTNRNQWATRIRNYGDTTPVQKPRGGQTFAIGFNLGADEGGAALTTNEVAGLDTVAQSHWNNMAGFDTGGTPATGIVGEDSTGKGVSTTVSVEYTSPNSWSSTGESEENNQFTGADAILMTGYLDTGAPSTTQVKISSLPTQLTSTNYDVYLYLTGGSAGRGGGYRITDANGTTLKDYIVAGAPTNASSFMVVSTNNPTSTNNFGNVIVFKGLKAASIIVEATTDNGLGFGGTQRAPLNAIQLVAGGGGTLPSGSTMTVTRSGANITITWTGTGTLESSTDLKAWAAVPGATGNSYTTPTTAPFIFYRIRQ